MDDLRFRILCILQLSAALTLVLFIIFHPGAWSPARAAGLIIAAPSSILLLIARFQLGPSFSVSPQARKLVTTGLYSKIRNPMYIFSFMLVLGFLIALERPRLLLLLLVLAPVQLIRAHQEARVLAEKFGDAYRQYRSHTWF
jgi:protein-S-isoprenylcysteine O-methyltransferase Ste14